MDVEKTASVPVTDGLRGRGQGSLGDALYLKKLKFSIEITIICRFVFICLGNSKQSNKIINTLRKSGKVADGKINTQLWLSLYKLLSIRKYNKHNIRKYIIYMANEGMRSLGINIFFLNVKAQCEKHFQILSMYIFGRLE